MIGVTVVNQERDFNNPEISAIDQPTMESLGLLTALGRFNQRGCSFNRKLVNVVAFQLGEKAPEIHGFFSSHSFWKAGSARKGSQSGSSLRRAGVIGGGVFPTQPL